MKEHWTAQMRHMDLILYWFFVALVAIGLATNIIMPPKMNVIVLAGIVAACFFLKPLIFIRTSD